MARFKVLITDYAWPDLAIEKAILESIDAEVVVPEATSEAALIEAAKGCDAILTNWAQTTREVIESASNCKIVSRMGIGLDNIDVDYCTENGIPVTNVPDYCLTEVAEHTLAMIFALGRNVAHYHWRTQSGIYQLQDGPTLRRLEGQTLGVVGLGQIGQQVAQKAKCLGFRVLGTGRTPKSVEGVQWRDFPSLLNESDYVSLHCPLTPETAGMMDEKAFSQMRSSAFLINTARGGIVDHQALADALDHNKLAGAALDVQTPEPPNLEIPPYNDPRVIVTPHAAFVSEESLENLRRRAATQVSDCLTGKTPESVVNNAG